MPRIDDHQVLQTAIVLQQKGNHDEAAKLYRQLIKSGPDNFYALHFLGVIEATVGNIKQAKLLMARSLSIQPSNIQFIENYATVLYQAGDYGSALEVCQQGLQLNNANPLLLYVNAISLFNLSKFQESVTQFDKLLLIQPNHIAALNERGSVLAEMKQYDAALSSVENALAINPRYAEAHLNKGNLYSELKRYDEAIPAFDRALSLNPNLGNAWLGCGNVFRNLKRYDEAFAAYDKALALKPDLESAWLGHGNVFHDLKRYDEAFAAYDKALALKPDLESAWLGRGNVFHDLKRYDDAFAAYDKALALKPDLESAWLGRGNVFYGLKRYDDAFAAYDKALALKPDLESAWLGRGNVFYGLKRYDDAFAAYDKALALKPDLDSAWLGRGNVFYDLKRYDEAFAAYDKALALKPDLESAEGMRLYSKMHICDWINSDTECAHLIASVKDGKTNTPPFAFLGISESPDDQLQCARRWTAVMYPPAKRVVGQVERYRHDRIRVAYVSSDFRQHPMSFLIAEFIESHDRGRFEVVGLSTEPEDSSEIGQRMKNAFERFIDVSKLPDEKIADTVRELEIDIAVDLNGYTRNGRPNIFARRAAPLQVSYMGFPGTMGADFIDYLIADRVVVPNDNVSSFSEKIVWMPDTYWVASQERAIEPTVVSRKELALPESSFVFCCFNQTYKIRPEVFESWMRILQRVNGSVLWLLKDEAVAANNLRSEARRRGVDPERLIFASRVSRSQHLARHRHADLFLDTLPYNAHTTASDALQTGLPVLTQIGRTFAGRVAASLLTAISLPELIVTTMQDYEDLAVELATNAKKLAAIKTKLVDNAPKKPLFDTRLFTRHMEIAYQAMYRRHQSGLPPDHMNVANPIEI
jgi:predicted O-linked N-acetylglucosamine transferase (SPINDLY family)